MREDQKHRRRVLEQHFFAYKGDISRSFMRTVRQMLDYREGHTMCPFDVYSDEKREYRHILSLLEKGGKVRHLCIPSTEPRTVRNELFSVNYLDREIRKDCGNHVRETVEFSRDVNHCMDRLWVYATYHNYVKPYRIRTRNDEKSTHAAQAGIPRAMIFQLWKTFFTQRTFVSHLRLSESEWFSWHRCYATPVKHVSPRFPQYTAA